MVEWFWITIHRKAVAAKKVSHVIFIYSSSELLTRDIAPPATKWTIGMKVFYSMIFINFSKCYSDPLSFSISIIVSFTRFFTRYQNTNNQLAWYFIQKAFFLSTFSDLVTDHEICAKSMTWMIYEPLCIIWPICSILICI